MTGHTEYWGKGWQVSSSSGVELTWEKMGLFTQAYMVNWSHCGWTGRLLTQANSLTAAFTCQTLTIEKIWGQKGKNNQTFRHPAGQISAGQTEEYMYYCVCGAGLRRSCRCRSYLQDAESDCTISVLIEGVKRPCRGQKQASRSWSAVIQFIQEHLFNLQWENNNRCDSLQGGRSTHSHNQAPHKWPFPC